jgi:hypothetical protein
MIRALRQILQGAFFLLLITGNMMCDKGKDSPEMLLTGKQWTLNDWSVSPPYEVDGEMITDLYALMPECAKDDFMVLNNDGTLVKDNGDLMCSENDPQTTDGTWNISADRSMLRINLEGDETEYSIVEITDDSMILSLKKVIDLPSGSTTYVQSFTYVDME